MLIVLKMDIMTRVLILVESDRVLHGSNTFGKGMKSIVPLLAMGK